jgi:hypothetical protein
MIVDFVPKCIREIANGAKDLCDVNFTYCHFVSMLTALLFGISSFCDVSRLLVFAGSVSSLSRAAAGIPHEALLRRCRNRVAALLRECESPEQRFVLITDDTLVRKFGATPDNCYWFDHCTGAHIRGRDYLVLVVLDTHTFQVFPVDVLLLKGKKHKEYEPRLELLKKQLLVLKAAGLGKIPLCADSWFAGKAFFEWLHEAGFDFEIEVKTNRKTTYLDKKSLGTVARGKKIVYPSISDVACGLTRNTAYSGGAPKKIASGVVRFFGSDLKLRFAAVWNINDTKKEKPFAIYVTNKTSRRPSRIWALSRFRWTIECHFRSSKQDFSFDSFPVHSSQTALRLIVLGMFLICSLELSRHDMEAKQIGKKAIKKTYISLSTWVKKVRTETENSVLVRGLSMPSKRETLKKHIQTRKSAQYSCSKPRDKHKIDKNLENREQLEKCAA